MRCVTACDPVRLGIARILLQRAVVPVQIKIGDAGIVGGDCAVEPFEREVCVATQRVDLPDVEKLPPSLACVDRRQ